jgi:hypothetical protein
MPQAHDLSGIAQAIKDAASARAKASWDAERAELLKSAPGWPMPAWSRTAAWRRRPYILTAALTDGGA